MIDIKSLKAWWFLDEGFSTKREGLAFIKKHGKWDEDFKDLTELMDWLGDMRDSKKRYYSVHPLRRDARCFIFDAIE